MTFPHSEIEGVGMSTGSRSAAAGQALSGYVPSYTSNRNTGEAYMARRGWVIGGGSDDSNVYASSTVNPIVGTLIPPAIQPTQLTIQPIITQATIPPIILPPTVTVRPQPGDNHVFNCEFRILRQANAAYDQKSSSNFQTAFQMVRTALVTVISQSALQPQAPIFVLEDLRNRNDDLEVIFRLTFPPSSTIDATTIRNIFRSNVYQMQARLGGNVQIDPSSILINQIS
ncbi:hypothetical protein WR25_10319 [Diploscapter pachys]|uniref:SEA domain-containing protein n=1 Tax=Diploscapter pachys TaxID=2018661 RepID=A0A2A2KYU9_9BILA|nr:hypothetical protein WR25_10319 [Diploscapter pachys]